MQVIEMTAYRAKVLPTSTQHFDHDFRRTSDRQGDLLNLRRRQPIPMPGSPSRIGGDVQERYAHPNINEPLRHVPGPNSLHPPPAKPSRDRATHPRPATWPAAPRDRGPLPADPGSSLGRSDSGSGRSPQVPPRNFLTRAALASEAAPDVASAIAATQPHRWPRACHALLTAHSAAGDRLDPT